jgi:hypothetical protein
MARKKFPRFDFYPTNFLDGVRGMPAAEVGDYIRLMAHMYDAGGVVEYDPEKLRHLLECRKVDVEKRIQKLIDREKIYIDECGFLHNPRVDKELEIDDVCPQVGGKLGSSCAQVDAKLKPNAAKNQEKTKGDGTSSRARALSLSLNKKIFSSGLVSGQGKNFSSPPEKAARDPPDYSNEPIEPSPALLRSRLVRKH